MDVARKASAVGRNALEQVNRQRLPAAGALDSAAVGLEHRADAMPRAAKAARALHDASAYIRDHDVDTMLYDMRQFVRTHPVEFLSAAVVAGYIVGRVIRGRSLV
jgi:hypothetical protein